MRRCVLTLLAAVTFATSAPAAVIVLGNYTPAEVTFTLAEPGEKPRRHALPAHHVAPFVVAGPADLHVPPDGKNPVRVDPYNAYALIPERADVRVTLLELPGNPPERDARPELNPLPRDPVKVPVTLLADDADPRADAVWQAEVRTRFDRAAAVIEAQTGFRLEFAGFATWESDPKAKHVEGQLAAFEKGVKPKPGTVAVGFTSRKLDDDSPFGAARGLGVPYVLVREWKPKSERERTEILVRYLAASLGAVTSPDPGSAMRAKPGDGAALDPRFVLRLDPLNALALNLWADQRRLGVTEPAKIALADRTRLVRVYSALQQAAPEDPHVGDYLALLEKDLAVKPAPKDPAGGGKKEPPQVAVDRLKRVEAVRSVVRAVTDRARENAGPAAVAGDELAGELIRAAADAALRLDEQDRVSAFLLGLGIALDDTNALRDSPLTAAAIREAETDSERAARVKVLGNPTLRNRRDLCRRFALGCAGGELLTPTAAENAAVGRSQFDLHRPAGLSFPSVAAEFAGVAFARSLQATPDLLKKLRDRLVVADILPEMGGLPNGLGPDKFEDDFGGTGDPRFVAVLTDIRKRVKALPLNRLEP